MRFRSVDNETLAADAFGDFMVLSKIGELQVKIRIHGFMRDNNSTQLLQSIFQRAC